MDSERDTVTLCPTPGCEWEPGHNTPCGIRLPDMEPTPGWHEPVGMPPPPEPDEFFQTGGVLPPDMEPPGSAPGLAIPAGPQLDPTQDLEKQRTPEQLMAEVGAAKKNRWLGIFIQLARSDRFLQFVERNYVIQDRIDEDKKQITTVVYENPRAMGPSLSGPQKARMFTVLKTFNTRKPEKAFAEIMAVLGQEHTGIIPSANEADVQEAAKVVDLKKDLD